MIVVHCSATRCNHPYTVHQLYHDHVEVNHWVTSATISSSAVTARYMPPVRWSAWVPMPVAGMHIPSESAMRADWMRTAMWQIPVPRSRRRRWRN